MRQYKCLEKVLFTSEDYSMMPIRDEDKYIIMQMRNEQIYHLRQQNPLTKETQELYFSTTIADLFNQQNPSQLLFSFLKAGNCIGYGGLVHINWIDKNAEISFIIKPELEKKYFGICWEVFLYIIEQIAFNELSLHKLSTYAFDLRPNLYKVIENAGFIKEAILKQQILFGKKFIDVIIHSKINQV